MKLRVIGTIIAIFTMFLSPFSIWFTDYGQADDTVEEIDKSELENIKVELYLTSTGEVKELDFEEYLCGVLLAEAPSSFDEEAIKAISVAARTYVYRRISDDKKYTVHFSADVCDDYSHCLGYLSLEDAVVRWGKESAKGYYAKIKKCAEQTIGEILYYEKVPADTVFHASSFGKTESAKKVWGYDVPYLVSVETPEEESVSTAAYTPGEFRDILKKEGIVADLEGEGEMWIKEQITDGEGRVESVMIGNKLVTGRRMREIFGLRSTEFVLKYEDGNFLFEVKGNGHGIGLSLQGCQAFAVKGKKYGEMLSHYYPGTELGLYR